uniref:Tim23 n=1 Tax=Stygiella incarcerata TaxID=1712417 RepID=A0A192ZJA2_9EUKA|nr:Tim23 [Stygiella incarcerata]
MPPKKEEGQSRKEEETASVNQGKSIFSIHPGVIPVMGGPLRQVSATKRMLELVDVDTNILLLDRLTFRVGVGYFGALLVGGVKGFFEGLSMIEKLGIDSGRLRLNTILNRTSKTGSSFANKVAALGTVYCGIEHVLLSHRKTEDPLNTIMAGGCTGLLYGIMGGGIRKVAVRGVAGLTLGGMVAAVQYYRRERNIPRKWAWK